MPVKCEGCKYYSMEFGCVCNELVYPCEESEIEEILQGDFPQEYFDNL